MNWAAVVSIALIFSSLALFLLAFFTRMKPCARRTRVVFCISFGAALAFFIVWGFLRNLL